MPQIDFSQPLKTGQRPVQLNTKTYKPSEIVFEEGSQGRELYIVTEGKVGIYKNSTEGEIELAQIGKGGIIGEMSLFDNMPRSATVKALENTKLLVVDELTFQNALKNMPVWLVSIIKIIISRLRDANKRINQAILLDKKRGVVSLILLLLPTYKNESSSVVWLDFDLVLLEAYYVCRLKRKDTTGVLAELEKRNLISITEDATSHKKRICINDLEVLNLFEEYLILKSQKKQFKEANIPEESIGLLSNIIYISQKSATETDEGTVLPKSHLIKDLNTKDATHIEKILLDLKRRDIINIIPSANDSMIIFKKETLSRIKKIKEWLPRFEMEVQ